MVGDVARVAIIPVMPIAADVLANRIADLGPFMYHVTGRPDAVVKDGIRPRTEGSESSEQRDFFASRAGHVYLLTVRDAPLVAADGKWTLVKVDLRDLEPARFDTDEDLARDADLSGAPWVSDRTPVREFAEDGVTEAPGQENRLARWAEDCADFDNPDVVAKSLAGGRVAYRGMIPAAAVEIADEASEGADRFFVAADNALMDASVELGEVPRVAHQAVEVERAYRLAHTLICVTTGRDPREQLRRAFGSRRLADEFRREARALNQSGEWRRGTVFFVAAGLAETCEELDAIPSWPHNRLAFFELADKGGELLTVVRDCISPVAAAEAAIRATEAVQRV